MKEPASKVFSMTESTMSYGSEGSGGIAAADAGSVNSAGTAIGSIMAMSRCARSKASSNEATMNCAFFSANSDSEWEAFVFAIYMTMSAVLLTSKHLRPSGCVIM